MPYANCTGSIAALDFQPLIARLAALLLLLFPQALCAQAHGLEVRPASDELLSQEPRQMVTTALQVRNGTGHASQFEARLLLPPGWRLVTPQFPYELRDGEVAMRFLSFFIPAGTASGDYRVTYEVNDRQQPEIRAAYTLPVRVLPVMRLQASVLDSPELVLAGQPYRAVFVIRNGGNVPLIIDYQFKSSLGSILEPASGSLDMKPGASQRLAVDAKTGTISRPEQDILTLEIHVRGATTAPEVASSAIKLLPRVSDTAQRYNTIPTVLRLRGMMRDEEQGRNFGWQAEAAGVGTIDDAGKRHVEFLLRGPDARNRVIFGTYDEYRGRYWDDNAALSLGDWTYALSPLTENGRYGRGGRAAYHGDRWSLETYYMEDRFSRAQDLMATNPLLRFVDPLNRPRVSSGSVRQTAVAASYLLTPTLQLTAHYLKDAGAKADISSLRGQLDLDPKFDLNLEIAHSQGEDDNGYAVRGQVLDERRLFRYRGTIVHADPSFKGYYQDEQFAFLGADYPSTERLLFRGAINIQRNNLNKDPARVANDQRQILLGSDYQWFKDTRISAEYRFRSQKDRRSAPDFDATHHGVGAKLGQRIKAVSFYGGGEWGVTQDHRAGQKPFSTQFAYGTINWQATERQSYSAYAFYDNSTYSAIRQSSQTSLGINAGYRIGEATMLDLNLMDNLSEYQDSYLLNGRLMHQLDNGHQIWLDARYNTSVVSRTDVMLTYSIPFGMPISRKQGMTEFRGRIYDQLNGQGLPNIVLNMGGLMAVTDDEGVFSFPSVKIGSQHLTIENASGAQDKVPAQELPSDIEVYADSAENQLEVAMIQGSRLNGRVVVYEDANEALSSQNYVANGNHSDKRPQKLKPSYGLQNVLVVMRNGNKTYKRLTDTNGGIRIAGLPPGAWSIEVMADDLPVNFVQERKHLEVKLEPGKASSFEYKIIPKIRKIKMLSPLGSIATQK